MERMFSKIIQRDDVKNLLHEVINNNRYNDVNIPLPIENNYFVNNNYALFLLMDSLIKFDIIISDYNLVDEYISSLRRIIKRMNNYQDINKGINILLAKMCVKKLSLSNYKNVDSKEKILRFIYKKYIVDGYFYYGFSSSYKSEIDYSGIKKEGFILDSRLAEVNTILKKCEGKDIIKRVETDITDNFVVASYFAFLGPDYLEKFVNSGIFNNKNYDNSCFYTKDINIFKSNLEKYAKSKHLNNNDKTLIINNFLDTWNEDMVTSSRGCIAFIKRSYLNRNYLKDIEDIIEGSKEIDISSSIAMIMESRYSSYELDMDISPLYFEVLDIPSYKFIIGDIVEEQKEIYEEDLVNSLKITLIEESSTNEISSLKKAHSYGFASIAMLIGLLLVSLGSTITIILNTLGR